MKKEKEMVEVDAGSIKIKVQPYTEERMKEVLMHIANEIKRTKNKKPYYSKVYEDMISSFYEIYSNNFRKEEILKEFTQKFEKILIDDTYADSGYPIQFDMFMDSMIALYQICCHFPVFVE